MGNFDNYSALPLNSPHLSFVYSCPETAAKDGFKKAEPEVLLLDWPSNPLCDWDKSFPFFFSGIESPHLFNEKVGTIFSGSRFPHPMPSDFTLLASRKINME